MDNPMPGIWNQPPVKKSVEEAGVRISLAVATLVLGVVSVAVSIVVTGFLFGLVGAILGIVCLAGSYHGKAMAGWGLGLSLTGMMASCMFGLIYYAGYLEGTGDLDPTSDEYEETKTLQDWIGKAAPDFTVTNVEGHDFTLSQMKGKRVLLNFWWPSSLSCRDAVEHLVELRRTIPEEELVILAISWTDAEEVQGVGRKLGINYPLVSAEELPQPYSNVYGNPTTLCIDEDGVLCHVLEDYHSFEKLKSIASAAEGEQADEKITDEDDGN